MSKLHQPKYRVTVMPGAAVQHTALADTHAEALALAARMLAEHPVRSREAWATLHRVVWEGGQYRVGGRKAESRDWRAGSTSVPWEKPTFQDVIDGRAVWQVAHVL
jgi:hypothetical protein